MNIMLQRLPERPTPICVTQPVDAPENLDVEKVISCSKFNGGKKALGKIPSMGAF